VHISDLPPALKSGVGTSLDSSTQVETFSVDGGGPAVRIDLPYKHAKRIWLEHFETVYIRELLGSHDGNISRAARSAGIDRKSIQRLMKRNALSSGVEEDSEDEA
jgi:DNA-binding NtrC family response regulator